MRIAGAAAIILTVAALAEPAGAQTVIDDSAAAVPSDHLQTIIRLSTDQLRDPVSAQLRRLRPSSKKWKSPRKLYCGEINAKNAFGGYVGFAPFWADLDENRADILPHPKPGERAAHELARLTFEIIGCVPERKTRM